MENDDLPFDDIDELEDFDMKSAKYQIWVFKYDKDQNILDDNIMFGEFTAPDAAVTKAKELVINSKAMMKLVTPESYYLQVEVETVVDTDEGEENVATIFQENIQMKEI